MEVQELEKIIRQQEMTNASTFKVLMRKVYLWMTLALMITGITAAGVANSPNILALIYSSQVVMWGIIIAEFGLVIYISARLEKLSLSTATTLFALYSILNGVMLSSIFLLYSTAIILYYCRNIRCNGAIWLCDKERPLIIGQHFVYGVDRFGNCNNSERLHEECNV